jgi:DeoR/GlpR family transcriptional regulator of sugar metabolism
MSPERLGKSERRACILAELRGAPAVRIAELADAFGVSTETIRRDLDALGRSGLLQRTYGGAAARALTMEPAISERYQERVAEREAIAACAVRLIEPGRVLMIDAGSTTVHFARRLSAKLRDLTVITNSYGVAMALAPNPGIGVILCPGRYDAREASVTGAETVRFLASYNADVAVIGASGLAVDGPNDVNSGMAEVKRTMLARARDNLLLVDRSKFDRLSLEVICPLGGIGRVVSDAAPEGELAAALERVGVAVVVAGSN